jgi:hypothetical protein
MGKWEGEAPKDPKETLEGKTRNEVYIFSNASRSVRLSLGTVLIRRDANTLVPGRYDNGQPGKILHISGFPGASNEIRNP